MGRIYFRVALIQKYIYGYIYMKVFKECGPKLTDVILSMSIKDRTVGGPLVILNACLSLRWPDNLFRPRRQVAQLRPGPVL